MTRILAEYNTDIIDRLLQTIEKREWRLPSVHAKVLVNEFIQLTRRAPQL